MANHGGQANTPDLQTQLEAMLDQVWRSEQTWRTLDRCDQTARIDEQRKRDARPVCPVCGCPDAQRSGQVGQDHYLGCTRFSDGN